eukprot:SAG31_NODE_3124_length_4649_cov_3.074066_2_plen_200_part_00
MHKNEKVTPLTGEFVFLRPRWSPWIVVGRDFDPALWRVAVERRLGLLLRGLQPFRRGLRHLAEGVHLAALASWLAQLCTRLLSLRFWGGRVDKLGGAGGRDEQKGGRARRRRAGGIRPEAAAGDALVQPPRRQGAGRSEGPAGRRLLEKAAAAKKAEANRVFHPNSFQVTYIFNSHLTSRTILGGWRRRGCQVLLVLNL